MAHDANFYSWLDALEKKGNELLAEIESLALQKEDIEKTLPPENDGLKKAREEAAADAQLAEIMSRIERDADNAGKDRAAAVKHELEALRGAKPSAPRQKARYERLRP